MSYWIHFKIKVEGLEDCYIDIAECNANITWNLREMIVKSTGLEWKNEQINGLCKDIIPSIRNGLFELTNNPQKYKQYEAENGWGTIEGCKSFFRCILSDWDAFCNDSWGDGDLKDVTYFYIG